MRLLQWLTLNAAATATSSVFNRPSGQTQRNDLKVSSTNGFLQNNKNPTAVISSSTDIAAPGSTTTHFLGATSARFGIGRHGAWVSVEDVGAPSKSVWDHALYDRSLQDLLLRIDRIPADGFTERISLEKESPSLHTSGSIAVRAKVNVVGGRLRHSGLVDLFHKIRNDFPARDLTARVILYGHEVAVLRLQHRNQPDEPWQPVLRPSLTTATNDSVTELLRTIPTHIDIGSYGASVNLEDIGPHSPDPVQRGYYAQVLQSLEAMTRADEFPPDFTTGQMRFADVFPPSSREGFQVRGTWNVHIRNRLRFGDLVALFNIIRMYVAERDFTARVYLQEQEVALLRFSHQAGVGLPDAVFEASSSEENNATAMVLEKRIPALAIPVPSLPFKAGIIAIGQHGCKIWFPVFGEPQQGEISATDFQEMLDDMKSMIRPLEGPGTIGPTHRSFQEPRQPYHWAQDSHGNWRRAKDPLRLNGWIDVNRGGVVLYTDMKALLDELKRNAQPRNFIVHISYPGALNVAKVVVRFPHRRLGSSKPRRSKITTSMMLKQRDPESSEMELRNRAFDRRDGLMSPRLGSSATFEVIKHGFPSDFSFGFGLMTHHLTAHATWLGRVAAPQSQRDLVWKGVLHFLNVDIKGQPTLRGFLNPSKIVLQYPQGDLANADVKAVAELTILMSWSLAFADIQALTTQLIILSERFGAQEVELELLNARHGIVGSLRLEFETSLFSTNAPSPIFRTNATNPYNTTAYSMATGKFKRSNSPFLIGNLTAPPHTRIQWPRSIPISNHCRIRLRTMGRQVPFSSSFTPAWIYALHRISLTYSQIPDRPASSIQIDYPPEGASAQERIAAKVAMTLIVGRPNHVPTVEITIGIRLLIRFVERNQGGVQEMNLIWEQDGEAVADLGIMFVEPAPRRGSASIS